MNNFTQNIRYVVDASNFAKIPSSPISYWVSENIFSCFDVVEHHTFDAMKGIQTGNGEKYLRLWYEVNCENVGWTMRDHQEFVNSSLKWFPLTSGGEVRKWYGNYELVVNLYNDGQEIRATGLKNFRLKEAKYYFLEGLTWTEVTTKDFACRYLPSTILFGNGGPVCFNNKDVFYNLALFNSKVMTKIMRIIAPTLNCGPDQVRALPVKYVKDEKILNLSKECVAKSKEDWDSFETSWDFKKHPLI